MKAKITKSESSINRSHRKESKFTKQLTLAGFGKGYDGKQRVASYVQARFYWTNSRCYCCVWINDTRAGHGLHISGSGYAGGYGYHKESAALADALTMAGIELSEPIGGRGDSAMESALLAIGKALKVTRATVLQAHG